MPDIDEIESDEPQGKSGRAIWSGTVTFGLVAVPVNILPANRQDRVQFRMVSPDGTPLKRRYFTEKTDQELGGDDIVRGYEVGKNKFVVLEDDELERLAPERTRDIDLRLFVKADEIDPMYFERAYYLTPAEGSNKAYRLLARAMEETGRAGIATFVMRAKEYLIAILAENGILRAETLRFADELRTPKDVGLPKPTRPKPAEVKKVETQITRLQAASLSTKELEDKSEERILKIVKKKLRAGDDVVELPAEQREDVSDGVLDLMAVLQRSLNGDGEKPAKGRKTTKIATRRRARARKTSAA